MEIPTVKVERRGCGWPKPGGLYFVCDGPAFLCGRLPVPLTRCPWCDQGIKPTRGFTWINFAGLLDQAPPCLTGKACRDCMATITRAGLLWVGGIFYERPGNFLAEADKLGISRRIAQVPNGFVVGEMWIALAHRQAIPTTSIDERTDGKPLSFKPGIFALFRPSAIQYVTRGDESEEQLDRLRERGISPVQVERVGDQVKAF